MSDLEGMANALIERGIPEAEIVQALQSNIRVFRDIDVDGARKLASAVLYEVKRSRRKPRRSDLEAILAYSKSGVSMGAMGVGSRGEGDIEVHKLIAKIASAKSAKVVLGPLSLDDAGAVSVDGRVIAVAVDGTHSRLSNFPFLAGFHVARACLRDIYVKGGCPVAMFDDIHLADDGDVGKLFDFVVGVSLVSELLDIPLVAGSTLRVGGDMVIGDRMVGCVGAVGYLRDPRSIKAKRNVRPGDAILMTEGSGGGTIATAAIYSSNFDVVLETLNLKLLHVCRHLMESGLVGKIHAMTDVTNGGLRGDANIICAEAKVGLLFEAEKIEGLVNGKVMQMLRELEIDPLGLSIDSLLIFAPSRYADAIKEEISGLGVGVDIVGRVVAKPKKARISYHGAVEELTPRFRESAYTAVKKLVGEEAPGDKTSIERAVLRAYAKAVRKRRFVKKLLQRKMGVLAKS